MISKRVEKFRLVQIGRLGYTLGFNLMLGKIFICNFHWSHKKEAFEALTTLNDLMRYPAEPEVILTDKKAKKLKVRFNRTDPPKNRFIK